jgi:hypothetical protein
VCDKNRARARARARYLAKLNTKGFVRRLSEGPLAHLKVAMRFLNTRPE